MKKFFKVLGRIAVIGAAVAGGVAVYKKFFAPDDSFDDLDDDLDLDDDFEEDLDPAERGYVSLSSAEEEVKEAAKDVTEEVKEAAENVAETVSEAVEEVKEDLTEA